MSLAPEAEKGVAHHEHPFRPMRAGGREKDTTMINTISNFALVAITFLSATSPALARDQKITHRVSVEDLDLGSKAGVRQADRRVYQAARAACAKSYQPGLCARDAYTMAYPALRRAIRDASSATRLAHANP